MIEFAHAPEATGPADVSLLRVLWGPRPDPLERWTRIREEHPHIARYRYGLTDSYLVTSAEAAKHVLQDNASNYTKEHPAYFMLRRLYLGYLYTQGAFWGFLLHGRPRVYTYIPDSLRSFVSIDDFSSMLGRNGYRQLEVRKYILGGIGVHWATKEAIR